MPVLYDNRYEYIKDLGEGGFGRVFLAKEMVSKRLVAIKQLKNTERENQRNIVHEIQIVARFNSPHIVTYYHHFFDKEALFLVMEYCSGGSLRDKMQANAFAVSDIFLLLKTLAECLDMVHKKGITHHDIKPDNILFSENGTIKISDFGIANTCGGTRAYMSPEILDWENMLYHEPRIDIYALGVTLMELLTGKNPFFYQSKEQIIALHQKADFPIKQLPNWQQEIILKAINKIPEIRFQSAIDLKEAIDAKAVPVIFKKDILKAARLAEHAEKALKSKKWRSAGKYLHLANDTYPNHVSVLQTFGKYCLLMQNIEEAKKKFEKAIHLNPRLDIQKELGWIHLENKNYPTAISLLSEHLNRHPTDYEAYNLLLRCYYETNRYEPAMELAKMLIDEEGKQQCFINNYYISCVMHNLGKTIFPDTVLKSPDNPFVDYNLSVVVENISSHNLDKLPTLKSKLLFMDYNFNNIIPNTFHFLESNSSKAVLDSFTKPIITIGREGYDVNDIQLPTTAISRRHCIIVNCKDDVWIYDLESTGTYLNNNRIKKAPIIGTNKLRIGTIEYTITTDKSKLL